MANEEAKMYNRMVKIAYILTGISLAIGLALKLGMGIQSLILLHDAERTTEDEDQFFLAEAVLDLMGVGLLACSACALIGAGIYQCADDSE